jgi:hypothetical protein
MSITKPMRFNQRTALIYSLLLLVFLIGINRNILYAGWLDSIKEKITGTEVKEQVLGSDEIGEGLREALRVGTQTVVEQLGKSGGFNLDPQIHIPLPSQLDQVKSILGKVGMESMLTDLESRMNQAAETAVPKAKTLFVDAINDMTLDDVMAIYNGPDDSATEYLKSKMSDSLAIEMKPIIDESLADVGAVKTYDDIMQQYSSVPFVPKVDVDLSDYVVQKGMDGIFYYLAKEEAAIRQDPVKRTTDILKQVFGQ